jgi:hypothetical protein
MKTWTFDYILSPYGWAAIALAMLLWLTACGASFFACTTKASFNKDGTWSYESCKNQENFKAKITENDKGRTTAEVETTATTPEAAIAAAMQSLAKLIDTIVPLLKEAIAIGTKGAVP